LSDAQSQSLRALIVDDDAHICAFIKTFTDASNFITTTLSESENFSAVYRDDYDLISLDLDMPKIDGIELIRFLGEHKCRAQIVLISSSDKGIILAAQDLATNQNLSVLGVLDKPINPSKLIDLLEKCHHRVESQMALALTASSLTARGTSELPSIEELRAAIENNEIDVHFQPKIQLPDQNFIGAEALARWTHPEKGVIPPDYFIPFAEDYGLIEPLTALVLNKTCAYISKWTEIPWDCQISVNISELSLGSLDFPDTISRIVKENGAHPSRFILEITESTLAINPTAALDVLTRLRLREFDLSIDDFGTGHSSLARLRRIPFRELKIDKSFVGDSDSNQECRIIIKNTIDLARSLGLKVVAEGAETQAHIDLLTEYGCDKVQGHFFSKALPNEQFLQWLHKWQNRSKDNA